VCEGDGLDSIDMVPGPGGLVRAPCPECARVAKLLAEVRREERERFGKLLEEKCSYIASNGVRHCDYCGWEWLEHEYGCEIGSIIAAIREVE